MELRGQGATRRDSESGLRRISKTVGGESQDWDGKRDSNWE